MDGNTENDVDNKDTSSYQDGSLYVISDFSTQKSRERKIKLTTYDNNIPLASKTITLIFDFITETPKETTFTALDAQGLSDFEKEKLESLAAAIRKLDDADRIIIMQQYNTLVENWMSTFDKTKNLLDLQLLTEERNIDTSNKEEIIKIIDQLLVNDSDTTNAVTAAITLIRGLIPESSANRDTMLEKIDAIASHPTDSVANRTLGEELLVLIQQEPSSSLDDKYKLIIRDQIRLILAKGDSSAVTSEPHPGDNVEPKSSGGIMGILKSVGTIILWILGIITGIILLLFIWYKLQSKDDNLGFQDFIIDRFANKETKNTETTIIAPVVETKKEEKIEEIDPLKSYTPPTETKNEVTVDPLQTESQPAAMPDWLKPQGENHTTTANDPLSDNNPTPEATNTGGLPSWLSGNTETTTSYASPSENPLDTTSTEEKIENNSVENLSENENTTTNNFSENNSVENPGGLPDWLKPADDTRLSENNSVENFSEHNVSQNTETSMESSSTNGLPDWLNPDSQTSAGAENFEKNFSNNSLETSSENNALPDWLNTETKEQENILESSQEANSFENFSQNTTDDFITTSTVEATIEEPTNELPDWLQSNNSSANISEKTSDSSSNELPDWIS